MFSEIQVSDEEIQRTESEGIKMRWKGENSKLGAEKNIGAITCHYLRERYHREKVWEKTDGLVMGWANGSFFFNRTIVDLQCHVSFRGTAQ